MCLLLPVGHAAWAEDAAIPVPAPIKDGHYRMVWHDEFSGKAGTPADAGRWVPWAPGKRRDAFNAEDAVRQDGQGHLVITIRRAGNRIETGGVSTLGKFTATHGYFECRCRMQSQPGSWSAFWVTSDRIGQTDKEGKPVGAAKAGAEIDVMEYLVHQPGLIHHTIHWDGYGKHHKSEHTGFKMPAVAEGFHTFAVRWDEKGYVFFTDGKESGRLKKPPVSDHPEHVILSCEVGEWGGDIAKAALPDAFTADWVRVWQTPEQEQADRARTAAEKADNERIAGRKTPDQGPRRPNP